MLTIIIPAYNEELRLEPMLARYADYFRSVMPGRFEIIVVVNGSTDQTADIARSVASRHPEIRVLVEPARVGKGGAVLRGMDAASGDRIGFVDADGATPPAAFRALDEALRADALVTANRWDPKSRITPQPWIRRFVSRCFNALVRMFFGLRLRDTQCGAKLWNRRVQDAVRPRIGTTQWAFDVDLLFQVRRAGFPILELPTVWNDQTGSHLRIGRASVGMALAITRLRLLHSPFAFVVGIYDATLGHLTHRPAGR